MSSDTMDSCNGQAVSGAKGLDEMFYESVCEKNVSSVVSLIENHGVDVNAAFGGKFVSLEYSSWTALHVVCKKGHPGLVTELLQLGADPSVADKKGETPLHIACKHGRNTCVELLLKRDNELKDKQNRQGLTPLCKALYRLETAFKEKDYYKTIDLLIQAGCDVNLGPLTNMTPLHLVAQKWSSSKVIAKLLKAGANVNAETDTSSPLMSALCRTRIDTATVSCLIDAGANVNYQNHSGKSVLHVAVAKSEDRCVKHLLTAGADPNSEDMDGKSPLWIAVSENNITITPLLLEHGGDVNFVYKPFGMSLLCKAALNVNKNIAKLLLEHKADVNKQTAYGATALHYSVDNGDMELVKMLLTRNCVLDNYSMFKDNYNPQNAVEIAASRGYADLVKLLLQFGLHIDDNCRRTVKEELQEDEFFVQWLVKFMATPRSLLDLCRIRLRQLFGTRITEILDALVEERCIPKRLSDVILMEDILHGDDNDDEYFY